MFNGRHDAGRGAGPLAGEIARMRTIWLFAVALGLAGAARADVVIKNQVPPPPAVGIAGSAACAPPAGEARGPKECRPSLRERMRGLFGSGPCCGQPRDAGACARAAK